MKSVSFQTRRSDRLKALSNTPGSIQKSKSVSPRPSKSAEVSMGASHRLRRFSEKSTDSSKIGPKSSGIKRKSLSGSPDNVKRLKDSEEESIEGLDAGLSSDSKLSQHDDLVDNDEDGSWGDTTTEEDDDVGNHQVAVLESESNSEVESSSELQVIGVSLEESRTDARNDCFNSGSELELHATTGANLSETSFEHEDHDHAMEVDGGNSVNLDASSEDESDLFMPSHLTSFTGQIATHRRLSSGSAAPAVYYRDEIPDEGDNPMRQQCSCELNQRDQSEEENEFKIFLVLVLLKFAVLILELIYAIM